MFMGAINHRFLVCLLATLLPVGWLIFWADTAQWHSPALSEVLHTSSASSVWPVHAELQPVHLPKKQCGQGRTSPCYDHYLLRFDGVSEKELQPSALFVPQFIGSLRIALNGNELAIAGSLNEPIENVRFHPMYVVLPKALTKSHDNELQFTIASPKYAFHWLKPVYIGRHETLSQYAAPIIWIARGANQLAIGVYVMALIFSGLMLSFGQPSTLHAWFGAFCLASVFRMCFFLSHDPAWEGLLAAAYTLGSTLQLSTLVGLVAFLLWPDKNAWLVKLNLIMAALATLLFVGSLVTPAVMGSLVTLLTNLVFLLLSPAVLFGVILFWRREGTWSSAWVLALTVGSFALTFHDVVHITLFATTPQMQLSNLAPILMVAAFWLVVADERLRYISALYRSDLERLDALERQRQSIRRDLHDGVAAQMASLVMMARRKSPDLAPFLQESLDELRQVMDDFDVQSASVQEIVADVRTNLDRILSGYGIASDWQISIEQDLQVSAPVRQAIYLGVKECVHNALRHAEATQISFRVTTRNNTVLFVIADNGEGLADVQSAYGLGRGISGLRQRLAELGGELILQSKQGTCVSLSVPTEVGG